LNINQLQFCVQLIKLVWSDSLEQTERCICFGNMKNYICCFMTMEIVQLVVVILV